jgi:hypothetical protein
LTVFRINLIQLHAVQQSIHASLFVADHHPLQGSCLPDKRPSAQGVLLFTHDHQIELLRFLNLVVTDQMLPNDNSLAVM